MSGPVSGSIGRWVTATFEGLGRFEGTIIKSAAAASPCGSSRLSMIVTNIDGKIASGRKRRSRTATRSLIPNDPHSTVYMPDGHAVPCQIIDYSMSGAAIACDRDPEIDTMLIVGRVICRVARHFTEGFGVEFLALHDTRNIGNLLRNERIEREFCIGELDRNCSPSGCGGTWRLPDEKNFRILLAGRQISPDGQA